MARLVHVSQTGRLEADDAREIEEGEFIRRGEAKCIEHCERTVKRKAELERRFGTTISKFNLPFRASESIDHVAATWKEEDHAARHASYSKKKTRELPVQIGRTETREQSRRAVDAIKKTVEIADGSGDFGLLMVAAFGQGYERYWKYARDVFHDSTGLRLIQETDESD